MNNVTTIYLVIEYVDDIYKTIRGAYYNKDSALKECEKIVKNNYESGELPNDFMEVEDYLERMYEYNGYVEETCDIEEVLLKN